MTRRLAQPPSGLHARVAEDGSKPVITTGSHSRRGTSSTTVVDGGKIVMSNTGNSMRHEEYMKTRMRLEEEVRNRSMKSRPETSLGSILEEALDDSVNRPAHYNQSGIECIDAIRAALGPEGFRNYCTGNALKYVWRHPYKNGKEDVEKAIVYLTWLAEAYDE